MARSVTARFGATANPLADARGSDRSPDREGGVAPNSTTSHGHSTSYTVIHQKPEALYYTFERKAELQHQTHYCPGCGHGIVTKLLAKAIDELGVRDRTVLILSLI